VQVFTFVLLAAGIALIWSLVDWRQTNYATVPEALRAYIRFCVALN
jgi:hypothetical protein